MPRPKAAGTSAQPNTTQQQAAGAGQQQDDDLFSRFDEAWRTLGPGVSQLLQQAKRATGANADLGCSCAKCLRKAGPVREDAEERILHITHVLADVYEETPNPEEHIKPQHRQRAKQFMAAVEANDVEKLESYFQECREEHRGEIVCELVIAAAQAGHVDTIRCLAKYAADNEYLDMSDSAKGARPLMFAAHNGHVAAVRQLLELGADPNAVDDHGYNALTISTFCDRAGVAEVLCQHSDTIIDQTDERERTALCYAALYGSDNCVHVLAANGANVYHEDDEGADPLDLAEQSGRASTAEALRKLQLKARMAQRRADRNKQEAERAASAMLDDKERARRTAEAEAKAAELLAECQREEAAKKAEAERKLQLKQQQQAAAKARKYAREKVLSDSPAPSGSVSGSEGGHEAVDMQAQHDRGAGAHAAPAGKERTAKLPAQHADSSHHGLSNGHATAGKKGQQQHGGPAHHEAGGATMGPRGGGPHAQPHEKGAAGAAGTPHAALQGQPPGHGVIPPTSILLALPPVDAPEPVLRRGWEALLEEAKACKEPALQEHYLAAIQKLMPCAANAAISVKFGRKLLQRLEAVGPARAALTAALSARHLRHADIEAALRMARPAASLLDADLLANAEVALAACTVPEEPAKPAVPQQGAHGPAGARHGPAMSHGHGGAASSGGTHAHHAGGMHAHPFPQPPPPPPPHPHGPTAGHGHTAGEKGRPPPPPPPPPGPKPVSPPSGPAAAAAAPPAPHAVPPPPPMGHPPVQVQARQPVVLHGPAPQPPRPPPALHDAHAPQQLQRPTVLQVTVPPAAPASGAPPAAVAPPPSAPAAAAAPPAAWPAPAVQQQAPAQAGAGGTQPLPPPAAQQQQQGATGSVAPVQQEQQQQQVGGPSPPHARGPVPMAHGGPPPPAGVPPGLMQPHTVRPHGPGMPPPHMHGMAHGHPMQVPVHPHVHMRPPHPHMHHPHGPHMHAGPLAHAPQHAGAPPPGAHPPMAPPGMVPRPPPAQQHPSPPHGPAAGLPPPHQGMVRPPVPMPGPPPPQPAQASGPQGSSAPTSNGPTTPDAGPMLGAPAHHQPDAAAGPRYEGPTTPASAVATGGMPNLGGLPVGSTSLPSPTAPLSVAAAALGLGGLSLQPFGSTGGMYFDAQLPAAGLLGALHNTAAMPMASSSMLPALQPSSAGAGGGFNMPGLAVPPALSALWSKPVPVASGAATLASAASVGSTGSASTMPSSPLVAPGHPQGGAASAAASAADGRAAANGGSAQKPSVGADSAAPAHQHLGHAGNGPQHHTPHAGQHQHHGPFVPPGMRPTLPGGMVGHLPASSSMGPMQGPVRGPPHGLPGHMGHHQMHGAIGMGPHMGMGPQGAMGPQMLGPNHPGMLAPPAAAAGGVALKQQQPRVQAAPDNPCVCCGRNERNAVCWPCLHVALCLGCANRALQSRGSCPVCGSGLENVFDVYNS